MRNTGSDYRFLNVVAPPRMGSGAAPAQPSQGAPEPRKMPAIAMPASGLRAFADEPARFRHCVNRLKEVAACLAESGEFEEARGNNRPEC